MFTHQCRVVEIVQIGQFSSNGTRISTQGMKRQSVTDEKHKLRGVSDSIEIL